MKTRPPPPHTLHHDSHWQGRTRPGRARYRTTQHNQEGWKAMGNRQGARVYKVRPIFIIIFTNITYSPSLQWDTPATATWNHQPHCTPWTWKTCLSGLVFRVQFPSNLSNTHTKNTPFWACFSVFGSFELCPLPSIFGHHPSLTWLPPPPLAFRVGYQHPLPARNPQPVPVKAPYQWLQV